MCGGATVPTRARQTDFQEQEDRKEQESIDEVIWALLNSLRFQAWPPRTGVWCLGVMRHRAVVAVAYTIVTIIYHLLRHRTAYGERDSQYFDARDRQATEQRQGHHLAA